MHLVARPAAHPARPDRVVLSVWRTGRPTSRETPGGRKAVQARRLRRRARPRAAQAAKEVKSESGRQAERATPSPFACEGCWSRLRRSSAAFAQAERGLSRQGSASFGALRLLEQWPPHLVHRTIIPVLSKKLEKESVWPIGFSNKVRHDPVETKARVSPTGRGGP